MNNNNLFYCPYSRTNLVSQYQIHHRNELLTVITGYCSTDHKLHEYSSGHEINQLHHSMVCSIQQDKSKWQICETQSILGYVFVWCGGKMRKMVRSRTLTQLNKHGKYDSKGINIQPAHNLVKNLAPTI